jgi:hypothetical protein
MSKETLQKYLAHPFQNPTGTQTITPIILNKIQLFTTMSMTGIKSKMMLAICNNIALLFKKIKGYNIKHINKR